MKSALSGKTTGIINLVYWSHKRASDNTLDRQAHSTCMNLLNSD